MAFAIEDVSLIYDLVSGCPYVPMFICRQRPFATNETFAGTGAIK